MHQAGVTLTEMLVGCAIVALLMASAGSFTRLLADMEAERDIHRLQAALAHARSAAVTGGVPVTLCPLPAAGSRCDGDWSRGFSVFADQHEKGERDPSEAVLRVYAGTAAPASLELRAFGNRRYFRFLANGQTDWQNGRFVRCPSRPDVAARVLVINVQGRVRLERPRVGDLAFCT
jgi:prepilin-type N-terminal cleavage/methylation domain-containing protein